MTKDEVCSDKKKKKKTLPEERWMQAFKDGSVALIAIKADFTMWYVCLLEEKKHNKLR